VPWLELARPCFWLVLRLAISREARPSTGALILILLLNLRGVVLATRARKPLFPTLRTSWLYHRLRAGLGDRCGHWQPSLVGHRVARGARVEFGKCRRVAPSSHGDRVLVSAVIPHPLEARCRGPPFWRSAIGPGLPGLYASFPESIRESPVGHGTNDLPRVGSLAWNQTGLSLWSGALRSTSGSRERCCGDPQAAGSLRSDDARPPAAAIALRHRLTAGPCCCLAARWQQLCLLASRASSPSTPARGEMPPPRPGLVAAPQAGPV